MVRIVIVGGGIAGLATAWYLQRLAPPDLSLHVRVVEPDVPGGRVRTTRTDGFVFEWGPHGFLDNEPDTLALVDELLPGRRLFSRREARRRFVVHGGRLVALPASPLGLLRTPLLSLRGRLRAMREPAVPPRGSRGPFDESIADFARRRFGDETVDALFDPLVTGVFAGDVNRLSLRCALPRLDALETEHGGVVRGLFAAARARRKQGGGATTTLCSFPDGMAELPLALARALGPERILAARATAIQKDGSGFAVDVEGGAAPPSLRADVLVLATPTGVAERLVRELDSDLASNLALIPHVGVAVACLTYDRRQVRGDADCFGFLCPGRERRAILGGIVASSVFEGHAPAGKVSLRVLLGGFRRPELVGRDEAEIVRIAHAEVAELLAIDGDPERTCVFRHARAIPQYNVGHQLRLAAIDGRLRFLPTLFLTGAGYRGVAVNDCVRNGRITAQNIVRFLLSEDGFSR